MDHFNINHVCVHCLRGTKVVKVDLSCFSDQGKLIIGSKEKKERFDFMCTFCWKKSTLDFYRFSHPDLICHLKNIYKQYEETRKALDKLYILFNNIKY